MHEMMEFNSISNLQHLEILIHPARYELLKFLLEKCVMGEFSERKKKDLYLSIEMVLFLHICQLPLLE